MKLDEITKQDVNESIADQAQRDHELLFNQEGFRDAKNRVYRPEVYAKGWARDRAGKDHWVELMAQER